MPINSKVDGCFIECIGVVLESLLKWNIVYPRFLIHLLNNYRFYDLIWIILTALSA